MTTYRKPALAKISKPLTEATMKYQKPTLTRKATAMSAAIPNPTVCFSKVTPDVIAIINGVANDMFDGNQSAAFRYIVRDWNKLKFAASHRQPEVEPEIHALRLQNVHHFLELLAPRHSLRANEKLG